MRTDLMLEIADMLDNLTPEERRHFNMGTWCGTSACTIGWACLKLESVRQAGLGIFNWRYRVDRETGAAVGMELDMSYAAKDVKEPGCPAALDKDGHVLEEYHAVSKVLEIGGLQGLENWSNGVEESLNDVHLSHALFDPGSYPGCTVDITPEDVSKRIREAVAHYDPSYGQSSTSDGSTTSASSIDSSSSA